MSVNSTPPWVQAQDMRRLTSSLSSSTLVRSDSISSTNADGIPLCDWFSEDGEVDFDLRLPGSETMGWIDCRKSAMNAFQPSSLQKTERGLISGTRTGRLDRSERGTNRLSS